VRHIALHGRTAADFYGGTADWEPIAELAAALDIPVLGNGDIWEADDALRMITRTGCAGVVVGRGCLGRPWLFADLAAAFAGRPERARPGLAEVARTMRRHAELLADWQRDERRGVTEFRKHVAWYLKGFAVGSELRVAMAQAASLAELDDLIARLDLDQPFPEAVVGVPRGRTSGARAVALPEGWLATRDSRAVPSGAEIDSSGG
jgi:tRNA-dihydrouridine synthase